ncbi:MAG: HEAT repeat domain-containing protein [Myxococcales bacterium]|nr:HEAT repeat domain-containing protein [Myxococcales bacterium]
MRRPLLLPIVAHGAFACSGPAPLVPPAQPVTDQCQVLDPPAVTQTAPSAASPRGSLQGLLPTHGPPKGPLKLGQLLTLRGVVSEAQWRALPPGADAELSQIAQREDEAPTVRARAMTGLAVRRTDGAVGTLRGVLLDAQADSLVRRAAARALADGFAEPEGGPAMAALAAAAADEDATLREAVVKALAPHVALPAVRRLLEERKASERDTLVTEALDAALAAPTPE